MTSQVGSNQWMPTSPCGPSCLPDGAATVSVFVQIARWVAGLGAIVCGAVVGAVVGAVAPVLREPRRRALRRWWFRTVLAAFGVRLRLRQFPASPVDGGTLVVANHVSWLDVVALQAVSPMRMVAKTEIRRWPVLGGLAARVGTLFIERGRLRGLPETVDAISEALRAGSVVGAYPEGTTWCGTASGRYRPAVFQAAINAGARVQPMALRFTVRGQPTTAAAFVGEMSLVRSMAGVVRVRGLVVDVIALPAIDGAAGSNRGELARLCEAALKRPTSEEFDWTSSAVEQARSLA